MIKLQDYTPEIYYKESRDFQFIGRLYDLVLNYVKTNADLLYALPLSDNSDSQFVELMATTLGFKAKHNYTAKHLKAVCTVFADILRNKGTIKAVELLGSAILNAEGLEQELSYELKNNNTKLIVYLPYQLKDTTLFNDVLAYILPAGLECSVIKVIRINKEAVTHVTVQDVVTLYDAGDAAVSSRGNKMYLYDANKMGKLPQYISVYNTHKTYLIGELCVYKSPQQTDYKVYKCISEIGTPEAFTPSHWEEDTTSINRESGLMKTSDAIKALAKDKFAETVNTAVFKPENED